MANTYGTQGVTTVHVTGVEEQASRLLELYPDIADLILCYEHQTPLSIVATLLRKVIVSYSHKETNIEKA